MLTVRTSAKVAKIAPKANAFALNVLTTRSLAAQKMSAAKTAERLFRRKMIASVLTVQTSAKVAKIAPKANAFALNVLTTRSLAAQKMSAAKTAERLFRRKLIASVLTVRTIAKVAKTAPKANAFALNVLTTSSQRHG
ncbi:hypothetical protein [Rubripirellula obstinata]|uniref:hypothetical protein n=1 Tax=Rubripirellula obstinata TaxID=406547 RepID=UPI00135A1EDA|nr:hypothetical protein [Rubripirellula obstinata]